MSTNSPEIQEDMLTDVVQQLKAVRRKNLLPGWIKVFSWIFLIFGGIAPVLFIMGLFGYTFEISLYGMETMEPLSITGICILCVLVMILPNELAGPGAKPGFRLELIVLVLYLNKLLKIKPAWENYIHT